MSVAFSSVRPRSKAEMTPQTIQKVKKSKCREKIGVACKYLSEDGSDLRPCARKVSEYQGNGNWYSGS